MLSVGEDRRIEELTQPRHVSPAVLIAQARASDGLVKWVGGGAHAHVALMREVAAGEGITVVERGSHDPDRVVGRERVWELATGAENYAAEIAALGLISYTDGKTIGAGDLRAQYVRLSDAELKEQCRG
jgi:hypothetical protein